MKILNEYKEKIKLALEAVQKERLSELDRLKKVYENTKNDMKQSGCYDAEEIAALTEITEKKIKQKQA